MLPGCRILPLRQARLADAEWSENTLVVIGITCNPSARNGPAQSGVPKGIRTPVTAVKGRCPRPLDEGDAKLYLVKVARILCWVMGYVNL